MGLDSITTNNVVKPDRILVHSLGGVGKTTFGADACKINNGVFILGEDGLDKLNIENIPRFPIVKKWEDFQGQIVSLAKEKHKYKTLVIDTIDGMLPMLDEFVLAKDFDKDTKKADAYGNKYKSYYREFNKILCVLNKLVDSGMEVICLAHSISANHKDPASETWQRWEINLPVPAGKETSLRSLFTDWCDLVLYAEFDVTVDENKRGHGTNRVVHTQWNPAYEAKSRYKIPEKISFSYAALKRAISEK